MDKASLHGEYVPRREEADIRQQVAQVCADGRSRVVLLYGAGGVGKTRLVRALASAPGRDHAHEANTVWVRPIDLDDSEYWLLSNLEREIASTLDPEGQYFHPYFEHLAKLPRFTRSHVGHETVSSHLGRIKQEFVQCYQSYVTHAEKTVVITLDTVEAVRSMYMLLTLTQWMKALPNTLFILSGRPVSSPDQPDPIRQSLESTDVELTAFNREESLSFLESSPLWHSLSEEERSQLVELSAGQPLWLAIAVNYLQHANPPAEMTEYGGDLPWLPGAFRRRMVAPYQSTDFWPEAIRRLAVVRHSVNQDVWQAIMKDRPLPPDVESWDEAWRNLQQLPWVRPRANGRYVTLHDAFAEELAQRLIPLHDQDGSWRRGLWKRAVGIYTRLTDEDVSDELDRLSRALRIPGDYDDTGVTERIAELDTRKLELDQLKTAQLHYQLLDDFEAGCTSFLSRYEEAARRHDLLFQELICHEFERFLPHSQAARESLMDVLGDQVARFGQWLTNEKPRLHLEIGLRIARFLTQYEQATSALELLLELPDQSADAEMRYLLDNERGNACMRISGKAAEAEAYFQRALDCARESEAPKWVRHQAQALKELGYYYRNLGRWDEADKSYARARDVLGKILEPGCPDDDREEMASIQTNWAYLKALKGSYEESRNLVESALEVRRGLKGPRGAGISLSVYGEVLRYDQQFVRAWEAYREAEEVFEQLKSWAWLGLVYQEQAICLFQAAQEGIKLADDPVDRSEVLIRRSLDICRDHAVRSYPSALNRAGRILGATDVKAGLECLEQSVEEARKVADGWFVAASLMEYLDLCYQAWLDTGDEEYRRLLSGRIDDVPQAVEAYESKDLAGRWELLQGHLVARDALASGQGRNYLTAVGHYSRGFGMLADKSVGSHGLSAIPREFKRFRDVFDSLPSEVQRAWYLRLRKDWSELVSKEAATSLLARLETLY
jgi:tetratricopeptide (TPR) repeat protein